MSEDIFSHMVLFTSFSPEQESLLDSSQIKRKGSGLNPEQSSRLGPDQRMYPVCIHPKSLI